MNIFNDIMLRHDDILVSKITRIDVYIILC